MQVHEIWKIPQPIPYQYGRSTKFAYHFQARSNIVKKHRLVQRKIKPITTYSTLKNLVTKIWPIAQTLKQILKQSEEDNLDDQMIMSRCSYFDNSLFKYGIG